MNYLRLNGRYWIGLTDKEREGDWQWINTPKQGSSIHWASGQPNDGGSGGNEDCGEIGDRWGPWETNDVPCSTSYYAICEHTINQCGI